MYVYIYTAKMHVYLKKINNLSAYLLEYLSFIVCTYLDVIQKKQL